MCLSFRNLCKTCRGRSNKSSERSQQQQQQQQHHHQQDVTDNAGENHKQVTSPQRSSRRISSISINMPAAGLGNRPPSIISYSSNNTSNASTDEGGFNEPSPEIKAKLMPAYDYENSNIQPLQQARLSQSPTKAAKHFDLNSVVLDEMEKPSLNYVDVGYRLNPDGSESREVYGETELYDTATKITDMHKKFHANGFAQETTTVYAIIKPDILPSTELYYGGKNLDKERTTVMSPIKSNSGANSLMGSPVKSASSPPVGVVSPIRRRSSEISVKSTPPMSPASLGSNANSSSNSRSVSSVTKGVAPIASLDVNEDFETGDIPALPERPPPQLALDLQDLEYADTSAGEDEDELVRTIEGDAIALTEDLYETAEVKSSSLITSQTTAPTSEPINRDDSLPDAMTADEAERLLSSRQQSLLSDEQAKEVEQILSAAPNVGVAVAAVVATATSPTCIKNLIEETTPQTPSPPAQQQQQHQSIDLNNLNNNKSVNEFSNDSTESQVSGENERNLDAGVALVTNKLSNFYNDNNADNDDDDDDDDNDDDDDKDIEDVDVVGISAASECLNTTFTFTNNNIQLDHTRHDDDEPEWLRDVLEAPKRSLENLLILQTNTEYKDIPRRDTVTSDVVVVTTASKIETTYDEVNDSTTIYISASGSNDQLQSRSPIKQDQQESLLNRSFLQDSGPNSIQQPNGNNSIANESLHESLVSVESTQSDVTLNQTTTIDDSIISSKHNSTYSLAENDQNSLNTTTTTATELDESQYYIPEYPPIRSKEVYVEGGVHYFEDGNFWMEVPGLLDFDDDELSYPPIPIKKNPKVRFSSGPIQVYSTFSVTDYDRRNEDVDPVAASAEYELEKRVEKMHVFPVELMKGPEGLGLSIIGMGVGADAGLEKLGIFVKTITDNGAAARDGRIQVNDQIIEVDGKSLVGVTQAYAASVLRNTSGLVKFQIGRERDPENSEVAQLIRLSLQADREKEERLKRQQEEYLRRTLDYSEDSTQPVSANSSVCEGPTSPVQVEHPMEVEATHSQEVESLKRLLQEHKASEINCLLKEDIIENLKRKLVKLETTGNENELLSERLRQSERELGNIKKEAANLQNMLQQSQAQYMALDKKYNKAKRLVREYQQREVDMCHREEFYQQLLQEKDTEYNALVKKLKDRVIILEHELQETQRKAGYAISLPYDSATLKLTPQMMRRAPPKPLFQKLETELSDTEISDLSPDGEGVKTATVERKNPVKDELDAAVPQHELLDNSANKTKIDLASRGGLANRQLPSTSNSNTSSSASNVTTATTVAAANSTNNLSKRTLSNSSSDCALDDSEDDASALLLAAQQHNSTHDLTHTNGVVVQQQQISSSQMHHNLLSNGHNHQSHHQMLQQQLLGTGIAGTTTAILLNSTSSSSSTNSSVVAAVSAATAVSTVATTVTAREQQINQLYAQVHKDHKGLFKNSVGSPGDNASPNDFHRGGMTTFGTTNRDLNSSYDSILGSNDKLSENEQSTDNWMYPSRRRVGPTGAVITGGGKLQPSSFTEQLNQALTERERRMGGDGSSRHSSDDYTEINKTQSVAAINCKTLINEIRQAVNEAQPKVKQVMPKSLSPPGTVPWQQQQPSHNNGPPSPTSMSSGCSSPGYSPSKGMDLSGSSCSFSERKGGYNFKGGPVHEWSKEQVGHWLMGIEMERYIPVFKEHNVEGGALLSLDSRELKMLGVLGDDKSRFKRRLKDLKASIEKERKDQERERREREKAIRKAEKKAAKKK
ncbi:uncharacterized protein LOC119645162 isoform X11 [Glossina fuscipes]|uniref:Neurabin-1 n=1 Tax=Glossina fuscipes TaxID=7396 RepID=A0A9C6E2J3_9MUSC|nr:uncharacterized protein LOC119645162 isoform X11 [Glossina fuscipes]